MKLILLARRLLAPDRILENGILVIEDSVISLASSRDEVETPRDGRVLDFKDALLSPGFIDIHVHGGAGCDLMDAGVDGLATVGRHLARRGVTSFLPTTMTSSWDKIRATLVRLSSSLGRVAADDAAEALSIHLEGPFLSPAQRGVHPPEQLLEPSPDRFEHLWHSARGRIGMMTIAPELPQAVETIDAAIRRGVCVSLGHSDADLAHTRAAIRAGASHFTHTFNAMRGLRHRDPGILEFALENRSVSADIIADGVHVNPLLVNMFVRLKGSNNAVLISDGTSATGCGNGRYRLGDLEVEVAGLQCMHAGRLAGSVLSLDVAVRNVMSYAGWELARAARLATSNPARVLKLKDRGRLSADSRADVVVLSTSGEVLQTVVRGRCLDR